MAKARKHAGRNSVSATDAQNNFGEVLAQVAREGRVFITRYRRPEAVVLSIPEYEALTGVEPVDLKALEGEFDDMVARMHTATQREAVDALFGSSPANLGKAAVAGARRKR